LSLSTSLAEIDSATECSVPSAEPAALSRLTFEWWDASRRVEALAAWHALEARLGGLPLMCSAGWTEVWLRHYGTIVPHRFAVGSIAGRVVGLALLTRGVEDRDGWFDSQTWHFGTAGEPDADSVVVEYNAIACELKYREAYFSALLQQLHGELNWDELHFEGFSLEDLPDGVTDSPLATVTRRLARWTDLDRVRTSGRELIQCLGDSTRKQIRQNLRNYGTVTTDVAESIDEAHQIFEELATLHQQRWNSEGQPGCYASRVFSAFHRELIDRLFDSGRLLLMRVRAGDDTLGCTQFLIDRGRALNYQGGRQIGEPRLSPGLITDYCGMVECLQRGYSAYDFMAGDSMHKRRLSTDASPLVWLRWRRPRLKYAVMHALRDCRRRVQSLRARWQKPTINPLAALPAESQQGGPA
jgi:hypothetical protein